MDYLVKNNNVTSILTTHYVKLCKKLSKNPRLKNYNMKTIIKNDNIEYTYLIQDGISKIKGGLIVLRDMNYPKEILDNTKS
jgi:DNA mismatch repair ATPase MutS